MEENKKYVEDTAGTATGSKGWKVKFSIIGPGIVLAATGVGSGDLVMSTVTGAQFGISLIWAVIIGVSLKLLLTEGVGRWTLATGKSIVEGWRSLGRWTMAYFFVYVSLFGLIYGAAIMTACGLMMHIMVPSVPIWVWAILHAIAGFSLIWFGRYKIFEKVITVLIGIMFLAVVGSAVLLLPNLFQLPKEALTLGIPDGATFFRILGLVGGIGGTMALAAYGYWIRARQWSDKSWIPLMRIDVTIAYSITGLFSISLMILSAQFLYGSGISFTGVEGMQDFLGLYGERFGAGPQLILNIGFWCATFSSLIGSWNGIPYLFADFMRNFRKKVDEVKRKQPIDEKDPAYRSYLAWLTFPSMLLLLFNQPIGLVLLYAALGSLFLPFLAITLLFLLNSSQVGKDYKNKIWHNAALVFVIVLFLTLGVSKFM